MKLLQRNNFCSKIFYKDLQIPFNQKWVLEEQEIINKCNAAGKNNTQIRITYFDQRCFNIAFEDEKYLSILKNVFTVYIDGIGMRIASDLLFNIKPKVFNSTDLYRKLLKIFSSNNEKVFVIGGNFSEEKITEFFSKAKIKIVGYQNGYLKNDQIKDLIKKINLFNPSVIIVGMGVPKQEYLVGEIYNKLNANVILCVGNFIEFLLETKKRAPKFLVNSGFEWLFRLFTEPKRLWKRYLIGIPLFILRIIILKLKK